MALISRKKPDGSGMDVDPARMRAIFDGINGFGRNEVTGGFGRTGFSEADMAARRWLADRMRAEGLKVGWDAAGNLSGRFGEGDAPCVMAGSHTDTVPEGGAFDGALGVAAALECLLAIRDAGLTPAHPIEVVNTADEEGRFGGMLGSQAMAGLVDGDWLRSATDPDGLRLQDAMRAHGFDPERISSARRRPGSVKAFLELHVEQGPLLERAGLPIGIADRVSGIVSLAVTLRGVANHSGTTPMEMRADAFAGLAAIGTTVPDLIAAFGGPQSRITIGKVELQPNFPHTIPGRADFSVILRDTDAEVLRLLDTEMRAQIRRTAGEQDLGVEISEHSRIAPAALDAELAAMLKREADRLGIGAMRMASGAGHDAQTMQALCPAGLIFVPSRDGISHSSDEWTDWDCAVSGARLLLAAMYRLASG